MNEKGIEKALKSSEVQRQTAEFAEKKSAPAERDLFTDADVTAANVADLISSGAASPSFLPAAPAAAPVEERGRGRPKGATNKSTKEWVEYFLNRVKKSPLIFLGELYSEDTVSLARRIMAKREDALKMQIAAASAVLPYVHQKQPVAVQVQSEELPTINIFASQSLFNQFNNGSGKVKPEIVIDAQAETTPEEISLNNNDLITFDESKSEKKV